MTATVVNGREIAQELRKKLTKEIHQIEKKVRVKPQITTLLVGNDTSSKLYMKLRNTACDEVGIISNQRELDATISEEQLLQIIHHLNHDNSVHGILVQYPLPSHISQEKIMQAIVPQKDVEGFNPLNLGKTMIGDEKLVPCTPLSVLTILDHLHVDLKGKNIVIINHSNIVGKPLAAMLLQRNATVSVCHVFTKDLKSYTHNADILISGAGVPKLITKDHIKNNTIIIDVGIVQTKEGVTGDVDFQSVKDKASVITPVPGGVGPVTIACALANMITTYKNTVINQ